MSNQVQFSYQIQPPGIASGKLTVLNKHVDFQITNISNPIYDLLKGLVNMIVEPKHLWDEENICWVDWFSETSCVKWILSTTDGKNINIKIVTSPDIFDDSNAEVSLENHCGFMDFCYGIVAELDRFIKELGLLNYEQTWRKDEFPLTYFLILKKYLIEHELWKESKVKPGNLIDEIDILNA
ncbi:hypothetical protein [Labilibacter marinus]|uniref:hypothetical protein n=1 Tax=Labilibacter marinus TaxID=1477105 RepID=UPI000829A9D1|nr:hypothetical protein [Labilibacter marinus]